MLDSTSKRRLKLLEILNEHKEWMTIRELSYKIGCSERIISIDIQYCNSVLKISKIRTSQNGARYSAPQCLGMKGIYQLMMGESNSFKLLERIFFDENLLISDLESELYISVSAVYRLVKSINSFLFPYGIKLLMNPLRVTGEEWKIRYFYALYFTERYDALGWPFEDDSRNVDKLVEKQLKESETPFNAARYYTCRLWTAIALHRERKGHYMRGTVLDAFWGPNYIDSPDSLHALLKENPQMRRLADKINEILQEISDSFSIELAEREKCLIELLNTVNHIKEVYPAPDYILYDNKKFFMDIIRPLNLKHYDMLYHAARQIVITAELPEEEGLISQIIYALLMNWKGIISGLYSKKPKVEILVTSTHGFQNDKIIADILDTYFTNKINVSIYDQPAIRAEELRKKKFDILLTDFPCEICSDRICICINNIPSKTDLIMIKEAIDEIFAQKE
ncbi:MAG: helix-turn-helix domain-containing protein [Lachnospiraceae bacterium]